MGTCVTFRVVLYVVIINIGATLQGNSTNANIGPAQAALYPSNYNSDYPVCASDDKGPLSDIKTFP